jgi:beta-lactam-binding protein with PASTA domain
MAAGAALLLLSGGWLILSMGPGSAVVPDVTRMREAQARARLAALGFPLEIRREVNRKVPSGVVFKQRPVPGTESSIRSPVLIVVSAAPSRFRLVDADWRGRPYDEVAAELRRGGLAVTPHVVTRDEAHDVVPEGAPLGPAGTVADISPDGDVRAGDSVTVTVIETLGRNE